VVLVGCMHFNPCSVSKAARVTQQLSEQGELGAVVIESCPSRWEKVLQMQAAGSPLRALLDNEMQAAAEVAEAAGQPVVLGDQKVEVIADEVNSLTKEALADLASPLQGGWQRTVMEIMKGFKRLLDSRSSKVARSPSDTHETVAAEAKDTIDVQDFLDPELFLGIPVAVSRYLVSTLVRAPKVFAGFVATVWLLDVVPESPLSTLLDVVVNVLFLRVFLGALLRDRDSTLAQSIGEACKVSGGPGRTVVAILGAAHCNGVRRNLLKVRSD